MADRTCTWLVFDNGDQMMAATFCPHGQEVERHKATTHEIAQYALAGGDGDTAIPVRT